MDLKFILTWFKYKEMNSRYDFQKQDIHHIQEEEASRLTGSFQKQKILNLC